MKNDTYTHTQTLKSSREKYDEWKMKHFLFGIFSFTSEKKLIDWLVGCKSKRIEKRRLSLFQRQIVRVFFVRNHHFRLSIFKYDKFCVCVWQDEKKWSLIFLFCPKKEPEKCFFPLAMFTSIHHNIHLPSDTKKTKTKTKIIIKTKNFPCCCYQHFRMYVCVWPQFSTKIKT